MMETDHVRSVKTSPKVAKLREAPSASAKSVGQMQQAKPSDKVVLSTEGRQAVELNRFVQMLREMPDCRSAKLDKRYDFQAPHLNAQVAQKLTERQ